MHTHIQMFCTSDEKTKQIMHWAFENVYIFIHEHFEDVT